MWLFTQLPRPGETKRNDKSIGGRLVEIAKKTAQFQGADLIVFDTLTPNLNRFL